MKKHILSMLLALCLVATLATLLPVRADASAIIDGGECGAADGTMTWSVTDDGTLTISGTGEMRDYQLGYRYGPWSAYKVNITKVIINEGITRIGAHAFYNMNYVTSFELPESLVSIGNGAFERCFGITGISLPANLTELGFGVFDQCTALESIRIPNGITAINGDCFSMCTSLTEISLPENLKMIGPKAFYCTALQKITLPESLEFISQAAFQGCAFTEVTIPSNVTYIDDRAFYGCGNLTTIQMSDNVTEILASTFQGCVSLKTVILPDKLTAIGDNVFKYCSALEDLTVPESVLKLGNGVFWNCSSLQEITFTGDCPDFAENTFQYYSGVIRYPADNDTWTQEAMQNYGGTITWVPYEGDVHVHEYEAVVTAPTYTEHGYTTHICECGESYVDTYTEPLALPAANIELARMILGNELAMQFAFKAAPIVDGIDYVVSITKSYANREDVVVTVPQRQWKTQNVGGQPYYIVSFNGIAAKEMGDSIRVQVKTADGTPVGDIYTNSVSNYAVTQLRKTTDAKTRALYVDMLNYGAAAQSYFGYDAENLVTAELTETEKGYGTQEVKLENNLVKGPGYVASQLDLGSSILLRVKFNGIDSSMYAVVSFTSHTGTQKTVTIPGSEFISGGTVVVIDDVVAADYNQDVTITVYDASGREVASAVESVASYLSRQIDKGNAPVIYDAVAKYCASAYSYLHK